ncbi:hypothetical protein BGZ98_006416 [Dissophora globulifera]|nr:hypothetical protein BGZ98_006416 [Dissophora globulifera]
MSNPAVTQWLQEIAAAKSKVQAKATDATTAAATVSASSGSLSSAASVSQLYQLKATTPTSSTTISAPRHGIITSYNLKTRRPQLQLILPPKPIKPGPGECCGNDCDPCVNTLYWEDLEAYRNQVQQLRIEYEQACRALDAGDPVDILENSDAHRQNAHSEASGCLKYDGNQDDDRNRLGVRSYRSFKILRKLYLSENTLLVICDLPYPTPAAIAALADHDENNSSNSRVGYGDRAALAMFHVLIRFDIGAGEFITKAFTPIDLLASSIWKTHCQQIHAEGRGDVGLDELSLRHKMGFIVKLYPSPHKTSDMFRQLQEHSASVLNSNSEVDDTETQRRDVLYLRGPIQTRRDKDANREIKAAAASSSSLTMMAMGQDSTALRRRGKKITAYQKERIVMIAAGSGITPMYQVLRAFHQDQRQLQEQCQQQYHPQQQKHKHTPVVELDLIYCNRTSSEIWLRQELQELCTRDGHDAGADTDAEAGFKSVASFISRKVRIQHVLSLQDDDDLEQKQYRTEPDSPERIHRGGRITLSMLRDTLQGSMNMDSLGERGSDSRAPQPPQIGDEYLHILVCGPPSFNTDVSKMLDQLGCTMSDSCEIHVLE